MLAFPCNLSFPTLFMHRPVLVPDEMSRVDLFLANFTSKAVHMPIPIEFIVQLVMNYQKTI
jgi:hypothetical protein